MRELQGKAALIVSALYVGFVAWSLYGAVFPIETYVFRMVHMAFVFGLAFLAYPIRSNAGRWTIWPDLLLALLGVASIAYILVDFDELMQRLQGYREDEEQYLMSQMYWLELFKTVTRETQDTWEGWMSPLPDRDGSLIFSAVCPARDTGAALVLTHVPLQR